MVDVVHMKQKVHWFSWECYGPHFILSNVEGFKLLGHHNLYGKSQKLQININLIQGITVPYTISKAAGNNQNQSLHEQSPAHVAFGKSLKCSTHQQKNTSEILNFLPIKHVDSRQISCSL